MSIARQEPIAVIGAGSWGTALAIQLARAGHPTHLWVAILRNLMQCIVCGATSAIYRMRRFRKP